MTAAAREVYDESFASGLEPEPDLTVRQWAEQHRWLTTRTAERPGRWRTKRRVPYMAEPMEVLSAGSSVREVYLMWGAQTGKTSCGDNWIGYSIDVDPCPFLFVSPTLDLARRISKQRIDPMIQESERLASKVRDRRSRDSGNSMFVKEYPGGILCLTGANSPAGLRSMPARKVFGDEIDVWVQAIGEEGEPLKLAQRAQRSFSRTKSLWTSTPTITGRSRIESLFNASDRRYYYVPCPECGEFQRLEWDHLHWDHELVVRLPNKRARLPAEARVWYECAHCGREIAEREKTDMVDAGRWVPEDPSVSDVRRGYHLSALYSLLGYTWRRAVDEFLDAKEHQEELRVWTNQTLAETFYERGDAPDWEDLYRRRENYPIGSVPEGGLVLTAGADVQADRIEVEVVAWGPGLESWSVTYLRYEGDTASPSGAPYRQLEVLLQQRFPLASGGELAISALAVDASYATSTVYQWVRARQRTYAHRVLAVQGRERQEVIASQPRQVDVEVRSRRGGRRRHYRGLKVWHLGSSLLKRELYGWLRLKTPLRPEDEGYPPGWCHLPEYEEEWFRQLTAEHVVPRLVRGYLRYQWEKTRERNEALDCRCYARGAAYVIGLDRWGEEHWENYRRELAGRPAPTPRPGETRSGKGSWIRRRDEGPWLR